MSAKWDVPEVPATTAALADAIEALIDGVSDPDVAYGPNADGYGKCVEAMWRAAYMAHELVAKRLGVTGFQHGVSSLTIVGALRGIEAPYRLVDVSNALYPQYDLLGDTAEFLDSDDVRAWLAEKAAERLATVEHPASRVERHWRRLVQAAPTTPVEG